MDCVLNFAPETGRALGGESHFDTFDRLHRDDGLREAAVEPGVPGDVRSESDRQPVRDDFEDAANSVAGTVHLVDHLFHTDFDGGIDTAEQDLVAGGEGDKLV